MSFDPVLAAIRYGSGAGPRHALPRSSDQLLQELRDTDVMQQRFANRRFAEGVALHGEYEPLARQARKLKKSEDQSAERDALQQQIRGMRQQAKAVLADGLRNALARCVEADIGFRERLTWFWADHFAVAGRAPLLRHWTAAYIDEAIRANMTGSFAELLKAAATHVAMQMFLNQNTSAGPNSKFVKRKPGRGLNENLAREVLELHTLGVSGDYGQEDVRQLAELFAGMTYRPGKGFHYRREFAEPGAETILGKTYAGGLEDIFAVLDDLAVHPDTARHIAWKLAVHFVSDSPDPGLVDHVAAAFADSRGDLMATYAALLDHPGAWVPARTKARQPFDFIAASLRALGTEPVRLTRLGDRKVNLYLRVPMQVMGHNWTRPAGPDGLEEGADAWITPQGMAARIHWAMNAPAVLAKPLPDPRDFVQKALGGSASEVLRFAAKAASNRPEGIGVVLASPEFQRR